MRLLCCIGDDDDKHCMYFSHVFSISNKCRWWWRWTITIVGDDDDSLIIITIIHHHAHYYSYFTIPTCSCRLTLFQDSSSWPGCQPGFSPTIVCFYYDVDGFTTTMVLLFTIGYYCRRCCCWYRYIMYLYYLLLKKIYIYKNKKGFISCCLSYAG